MRLFGKEVTWEKLTTRRGKDIIVQKNVYRCPVCFHVTSNYLSMVNHVVRIHKFNIPIRKK